MSIQAIVQIAEQTNVGKIDGIFQIARCVNNLYEEVNIKGRREKFEKAALKHLGISKAATYIWLKINRNESKLLEFKSLLPININCLDIIASMSKEEIENGIRTNKINIDSTNIVNLRDYQHTLDSYNKRNANVIKNAKVRKERKEQEKEKILEKQKIVKEDFDLKANKDKECLYEDIELKLKFLEQKMIDSVHNYFILKKENEELKNRIDLIQKLLMKM